MPALAIALAACAADSGDERVEPVTTAGAIAIANLDHAIAQCADPGGLEELLLARARFLGDYGALDRAVALAEPRFATAAELVQRARVRSAVHRFADALDDLAAAERAGAAAAELVPARAAIQVATGRAGDAIAVLEAAVARRPDYASRSALATAYAAAGRLDDADRLYDDALASLDTTSPFPYAWIAFARGRAWAEHGEPARAAMQFARALAHLPSFTAATIELAEIEAARGELGPAIGRLERIAATDEPEALALLGQLHVRTGERASGRDEIARARRRFDALLARHPLAFADHAAEFFLGPGGDPARAWRLATANLANRPTPRALALALEAASSRR